MARGIRLCGKVLFCSIMIIVVVLLISIMWPYKKEEYKQELDGEDPNNHSCVKLMKTYPSFQGLFDAKGKNALTKEAQDVAYALAPSMTDVFMETDTQTVMKGACIIPNSLMQSYNLTTETRSTPSGDETWCKGQSEDGKVSVVLPYVKDKVSGCGIMFNKFDAKGLEKTLLDLHYIGNEQMAQALIDAKDQVGPYRVVADAYNNLNDKIVEQTSEYNALATKSKSEVSNTQTSLQKANNTTKELTAENESLKAMYNSSW